MLYVSEVTADSKSPSFSLEMPKSEICRLFKFAEFCEIIDHDL